jgi:hypothetical protein
LTTTTRFSLSAMRSGSVACAGWSMSMRSVAPSSARSLGPAAPTTSISLPRRRVTSASSAPASRQMTAASA